MAPKKKIVKKKKITDKKPQDDEEKGPVPEYMKPLPKHGWCKVTVSCCAL